MAALNEALPLLCHLTKFRAEATQDALSSHEWSRRLNWMLLSACEAVVSFEPHYEERPDGKKDWIEYPWPIAFDARPESDDERELRFLLLDLERKAKEEGTINQ